MVGRNGLKKAAATFAATVLVLGAVGQVFAAPIVLKEGETVNGYIRNNSQTFRFRNQSKTGAPTESAVGQEFSFTAQRGDSIEISVDAEDGSNLQPVLVLLAPQTGKQVGYDASLGLLRYRVPTTGTYRLLVLAKGTTRGRYTVAVNGLSGPIQVSEADRVMTDVLKLRIIGCGVPNVARIKIGNDERCTRDIEAGEYVYDPTNRRIATVDRRRELLGQRLQLTVLDRCPSPATSVAQITLTDPQDGKDYTYCATPSRFVKAGAYRYNVAADELVPATTAQVPTTPTQPTTPIAQEPDSRRDLLQKEYGLSVLASCPAARSSLVVVNFPESDQVYTYCANPNRLVRAGEYVYNTQADRLEPAKKTADCALSVAGVCIVK